MRPANGQNGVFEAAAVISTGRPVLAICNGIIRKVACPTGHGCWVVFDPSTIRPAFENQRCSECKRVPQDVVWFKGTAAELKVTLEKSLFLTLSLI